MVLKSGYGEKYIEESINTKFLSLQIGNHLQWKNHTDLTTSKLSKACCAIRLMSHISGTDTLKSIYFAYFHSIMKQWILFGVFPQQ
jgi:NADH:ubiquinone oxidoreductase subunit B-like Fe-S oxidoreductase